MNAYAAENDWKLTNIDAAALADTVARYNELCAAGRDEDFGKAAKYLVPIEGGPYYAIPRGSNKLPAILGGLVVDGNHQCLNGEFEPIGRPVRRGNASGQFFGGVVTPWTSRGSPSAAPSPRATTPAAWWRACRPPPSHPPVPGRRSLPVGRAFCSWAFASPCGSRVPLRPVALDAARPERTGFPASRSCHLL